MGIYPETRYNRLPDGRLERVTTSPGLTVREVFELVERTEDRTDCYCCSCPESGGFDPYCRNHGWAGERPCTTHNMPGTPNDSGMMPVSVQEARRA